MKRREMPKAPGAAVLGLSAFPLGLAAKEKKAGHKQPKVLYFTRSVGYEHSVVKRKGKELSFSEKLMVKGGKEHGVEVVCTKDGGVFDGDLGQYACIAFYSCGDQFKPSIDKAPPITRGGMKKLLAAIAAGKPFVGLHSTCYTGPLPAGKPLDPFLTMLGGGFIAHGAQQQSTMKVVSPHFPGAEGLGGSFAMREEWYSLKDFAKDLHVILVQETAGMKGPMYQRPPYPSTWARMYGRGRVFYTAMGHREDVWTSKPFQQIVLGGFRWALGHAQADITPNIERVTPKARQVKR
jgi:uncharacterized protein